MTEYVYDYAVKINHLSVNSKCEVFFTVKGKRYTISQTGGNRFLESEDGIRCKVLLFAINENILNVITDGECKLDNNWSLLNVWEKAETK